MPDNRKLANRPDAILHEYLDAVDRALEDTHRHLVRISQAMPTAKGARARRDWLKKLQSARLHVAQMRGLFPADITLTLEQEVNLRAESPING